jgi:hypothetical protein
MTHEYAHELLHRDDGGQAQSQAMQECHAEAVSYIVSAHVELHNHFSSDYLQQWGTTPDLLPSEFTIVTATVAHIAARLTPTVEDAHPAGARTTSISAGSRQPEIVAGFSLHRSQSLALVGRI